MRRPASGDHASRRFVGVTRAGHRKEAVCSLVGVSMLPREARLGAGPLQFVQGGLVSNRGAAIRVNVLCFEGLLSVLSQMIPRWFRLETGPRLLPGVMGEHCSFRSRRVERFVRIKI